jgi:hypothetical protein
MGSGCFEFRLLGFRSHAVGSTPKQAAVPCQTGMRLNRKRLTRQRVRTRSSQRCLLTRANNERSSRGGWRTRTSHILQLQIWRQVPSSFFLPTWSLGHSSTRIVSPAAGSPAGVQVREGFGLFGQVDGGHVADSGRAGRMCELGSSALGASKRMHMRFETRDGARLAVRRAASVRGGFEGCMTAERLHAGCQSSHRADMQLRATEGAVKVIDAIVNTISHGMLRA